MQQENSISVNGQVIFKEGKLNGGLLSFILYDTYGFPFDLTQQILKEHNIVISEEDFNEYLEQQRQRSKIDRNKHNAIVAKDNEVFKELALSFPVTEKLFYNDSAVKCQATILAIVSHGDNVNEVNPGEECWLILDKTTFYATGGGEVGDFGVISSSKVIETRKLYGEMVGHRVLTREKFKVGDIVSCFSFRKNVCKNHTATHLLQAALRKVLGNHVQQKGSQVDENGLRFDFSSNSALTDMELKNVETIVNKWISEFLHVQIDEMKKVEAEKLDGVMKLFDEKYGDIVRVVRVLGHDGIPVSTELCGGLHCSNTGEIEAFAIESEKSIGSGIRRIIAVTGADKCAMLESARALKKSFELLKNDMAKYQSSQSVQARYEAVYDMRETAQEVNGVLLMQGKNINEELVRIACRYISSKNNKPVFAVVNNNTDGVNEYFCYITCNKNGNFDCNKIAQKLIAATGGKGGGTSQFAQVKHKVKGLIYQMLIQD